MKKIIAVLSATLMLAGCGEVSAPTIYTEPVATTIATEATTETQPINTRFEFGEEVWIMTADEDSVYYLGRYNVVTEYENFVAVVPCWGYDISDLREKLELLASAPPSEESGIYLFTMDQVYQDKVAAMIAVAEANGETFEEYWGCAVEDAANE